MDADQTMVYVWGYGSPQNPFFRDQGQATEDAEFYAAVQGWDAGRQGAWAKEIVLPLPLSEALEKVRTEADQEPAVSGWIEREDGE